MTDLYNCQFYCLSYYKEKRDKMKKRFENLEINCNFYDGIKDSDERIKKFSYNNNKKRYLSTMYGHLDIINDFYHNTNNIKYAVICEDDIIIHKDIKDLIRKILIDINIMDLDILLLSYMMPYKITVSDVFYKFCLKRDLPINSFYKYHEYPKYISGTQMYIITRPYAKYILDNYYCNDYKFDSPFIIDKILIHHGNRALLYPMLAIENDEQEDSYHKLCHKIHYSDCYI
jgi:GR25 family glycosyltransferase involved in LPS biosynthesis